MKAMYRVALMAAAFVFLLPLSARSEIRAGSFEINPFAGYNFFQNSQNLDSAPMFGARLGYNFTRYFGIEVTGEYMKTNLKLLSWVASILSLSGVILNAQHIIYCWPIWCIANVFWIFWAYKKREWSQFILWIAFTLSNLYGWWCWLH